MERGGLPWPRLSGAAPCARLLRPGTSCSEPVLIVPGSSFPEVSAWCFAGRCAEVGGSLKVPALDAFSVLQRDAVCNEPREVPDRAGLPDLFEDFDLGEPASWRGFGVA